MIARLTAIASLDVATARKDSAAKTVTLTFVQSTQKGARDTANAEITHVYVTLDLVGSIVRH